MCAPCHVVTIDGMTNTTSSPLTRPDATRDRSAPDRSTWRRRAGQVVTLAVALFLVSSGATKFAGGHVFAYIEHRSGLGFFDPLGTYVVGAAEVVAGALVVFRRTRTVGAAIASFVMAGAVAFHLSPWLGVSMPTGLVEGAEAPWTAEDFADTTTVVPFVLAIGIGAWCWHLVRSGWTTRHATTTTETAARR